MTLARRRPAFVISLIGGLPDSTIHESEDLSGRVVPGREASHTFPSCSSPAILQRTGFHAGSLAGERIVRRVASFGIGKDSESRHFARATPPIAQTGNFQG